MSQIHQIYQPVFTLGSCACVGFGMHLESKYHERRFRPRFRDAIPLIGIGTFAERYQKTHENKNTDERPGFGTLIGYSMAELAYNGALIFGALELYNKFFG